ncbi:MAG TPA: FAD-dependent oxidoreductase [Azospirillaceae bacterium]|nr:FAD-dependent oxidoreductase [Azospirillaceae bacterium]
MDRYDIVVVGGGIAGASAAWAMAEAADGRTRRVLLLEREAQPGYHATGRSAALFSETYGNAMVRALSVGSRAFLAAPPAGFTDHEILTPRGAMHVGSVEAAAVMDELAEAGHRLVPSVRRISAAEAKTRVPVLRDEAVTGGGVLEPDAQDIETHGLLAGFLRAFRARGGRVVTDAEVTGLTRDGDGWRLAIRPGTDLGDGVRADVVVNAAGAWCDVLGEMAGARPVGLVPKRRTALLFDPPAEVDSRFWPMVIDAQETFYFKPDAGKLLASPADETPSPPTDAQPEELDIAIAADRVETATTLRVGRISHSWAGLRTFAPDKIPVVGFDPGVPGFFWLGGQGGYGFQTCHALARIAAALVDRRPVPGDLEDLGITAAALSPGRFG